MFVQRMLLKIIVIQENKLISYFSQVEKSRKWQRSLIVTFLLVSFFSNDGDSDWDETKRKQFKIVEIVKDYNGFKKFVEVEKGKVFNVFKRYMFVYMLCLMLFERRLSLFILDIFKKVYKIWKGMFKEKKEEWDCKVEDIRREYLKSYERI